MLPDLEDPDNVAKSSPSLTFLAFGSTPACLLETPRAMMVWTKLCSGPSVPWGKRGTAHSKAEHVRKTTINGRIATTIAGRIVGSMCSAGHLHSIESAIVLLWSWVPTELLNVLIGVRYPNKFQLSSRTHSQLRSFYYVNPISYVGFWPHYLGYGPICETICQTSNQAIQCSRYFHNLVNRNCVKRNGYSQNLCGRGTKSNSKFVEFSIT